MPHERNFDKHGRQDHSRFGQGRAGEGIGDHGQGDGGARPADSQDSARGHRGPGPQPDGRLHDGQPAQGEGWLGNPAHQGRRPAGRHHRGVRQPGQRPGLCGQSPGGPPPEGPRQAGCGQRRGAGRLPHCHQGSVHEGALCGHCPPGIRRDRRGYYLLLC